jgi:hypothetical protein
MSTNPYNPAFNAQLNNLNSLAAQLSQLQQQFPQAAATMPNLPQLAPTTEQPRQVRSVSGLTAAIKEQEALPNGSSEILMDDNEPTFYMIVKDENGKTPKQMTVGHFTVEMVDTDSQGFVTRRDFEAFEQRVIELLSKHEDKEAAE